MSQPCRHCGHARAQHRDDMAGMCVGCKCEGYEAASPLVSEEATQLAMNIAGLEREALAAVLQEVLDQRDSWHRECSRAIEQRDAALRRGNKLEAALSRADEEIGRLKGALDLAHQALGQREHT